MERKFISKTHPERTSASNKALVARGASGYFNFGSGRLPARFPTATAATTAIATAASESTTATAAAPVATEAAATAATARTTRFTRPRLVDVHSPAIQLAAVEFLDRPRRFVGIGHLDECKPTRLARIPVPHNAHAFHNTVPAEYILQFFLCSSVGEVSYENIGHLISILTAASTAAQRFPSKLISAGHSGGQR
jgi:hypothetical protein